MREIGSSPSSGPPRGSHTLNPGSWSPSRMGELVAPPRSVSRYRPQNPVRAKYAMKLIQQIAEIAAEALDAAKRDLDRLHRERKAHRSITKYCDTEIAIRESDVATCEAILALIGKLK